VGADVVVCGCKSTPNHNVQVVKVNHGPGNATHVGIGAGVAVVGDIGGAFNIRPHLGTFGAVVAHRVIVLDEQLLALLVLEILLGGEDHSGHLAHRKDVSAVADELGGNVGVGAVDQGDDHDERGHGHHHAQQRKDGAHLVGPQGLQREFDCLTEEHSPAF
jgi:hypothetical protein